MYQENEIVPTQEEVLQVMLKNPFVFLRQEEKRLSLYEFLRAFWYEVSEDPFKDNWHIKYLCNELEQVARVVASNRPKKYDLVVNIPPGTTKTIICSIMFPAWCWASGWWWMRFITASYSATLALESAEKSRDLIRSDKFQALFPDLSIKEDKDTKSNFRIVRYNKGQTRLGGNRFSTSVGGTLTGFHGHILIVDDPLNPEQAASEKALDNCNRWMEQTLPTRKVDKDVSAMVLIMQRLHQNDPTGRIIEKKKSKLRHICLPGQIRDYGKYLKPEELSKYYRDDLLDPNRLSWDALNGLLEDLGQYGFAGQIGQNPAPPGGGMFRPDRMPVAESVREVDIARTVRYWDKAASEDSGAYTCGVKMAFLKNRTFVILDVIRGQWAPETREKIIHNTAEIDGRKVTVFVEQEPGSGGKESVQATIKNLAGFAVYADRPTGDKIRRADPYSVQVNNGNVAMLRADWNRAYREELEVFPFGTYKDQVDASSGAFNLLVKKKEVRIIR